MRTPCRLRKLFIPAVVLLAAGPLWADLVVLKDGRQWEGSVESESAEEVVIRTVGGPVALSRQDIADIQRGPTRRQEYEQRRARLTEDDVEGHLALARWCAEQELPGEATYHFQLVVALDPENVEAHQALGDHRLEGRWVTPEGALAARGLVEYQGRWLDPAEAERAKKDELRRELEGRWRKQLRALVGRLLLGTSAERAQAAAGFLAVEDRMAAPAVVELLEHRDPGVRRLALEVVATQGFRGGDAALVTLALRSDDPEVRRLARLALAKSGGGLALKLLVEGLAGDKEEVRRRSAVVLGQLGDRRAVPYLIESIKETVVSGNAGGPVVGGLRARDEWVLSDYDTVTAPGVAVIKPRIERVTEAMGVGSRGRLEVRTIVSYEAVDALEAITGRELGDDQEAWRQWWRREGRAFLRGLSSSKE